MNKIGKQKILKQLNRKTILNLLRDSDELSVSEIAEIINLSKPTIMKIMNYYIEKGFIIIKGKGSSTEEGGKKPNIFKFNANGGYSIGMSITANKLRSAITNLKGEILNSLDVDINYNEDLDSILDKIINSYYGLLDKTKVDSEKVIGLAVGIYGLTDYDKGIVFYSPHYPSWGKNIKMQEKIKKRIPGNVLVIIDNLPRFQVFAEMTLGAARNSRNVVSIFAGYGLGSGIIYENDISRGAHKIMGEVGHMIINPSEEQECACGARGCFEVMVSMDRLRKVIELNKERFPESVLLSICDNGNIQNLDPEEIFNAYRNKDTLAVEALNEIIGWFAVGLSNIILIYDPELIVLHGIYTKAGDGFLEKLGKKTGKVALKNVKKETKIKFSELGSKASVLGAATYVINRFFS
ncbi:MAG: ROK family transcriptional regulator [Actinobacteria bacterium]|nr:ROK family transcriptional regulator [Actinomycetota bacterium]